MPALSQLSVSNLALSKLPASPIASLDENSLEARECRRFYPQVVADMLEGPHDWSFANKLVLLAAVTNDRDAEWLYAYALPNDLGSPIRVLPDLNGIGLMLPIPIPGSPYAEAWVAQLERIAMDYEIEGDTLYTNAATATLEYTVNDVAGMRVSQLAVTAMALDLAARICIPIKQDQTREQALMSQAELAWQRAIADDRNRQPECYGEYLPESIAVRHWGY
jgi:hypothetical protein